MSQAAPYARPRRASRYGRPRPPGRFRRYVGWVALALIVLVSGFIGYVLWTLRELPDPGQQPVLGRSIVVYDGQGREVAQRNSEGQYYEELRLQDMGPYGPTATLAAEDRNFYHHGPIDYAAVARAALADVLHRSAEQGGSTITQQLVKISVLTPQRSVMRKAQEAVLATAMEQRYSKDRILEMYLNRVFYGHNAYGLGAATRVYFGSGKQTKDLTVGEAAFLAGLINGPSYFDPQLHYDRARDRQLYVLDGMVKTGAITQAQADQAAQENIQAELKFDQSLGSSLAPHFVDWVLGQLEQRFGANAVQNGGFKVYTTLDLDLQARAQQAVTNGVARMKGLDINNGDLMAADPKTGAILAWVGSADYYDAPIGGQYDVITAGRQPGSSFKPYVYEAALRDHRITLGTTVHDVPTDFGGYRPSDYDNRFLGNMTAARALLLSRNVPAIEVAQKEGIQNVIALAHQMGVKSDLQPVLPTAIGGSEITMWDNVQGYQVFADQGTLMPLMAITKITDAQDGVLFQAVPGRQAGIAHPISPAEAYLITATLKGYPGYWDLGWKRQMAGKSGTTDASTGHRDAWMMGYNPDIVVGAWAGNTAAGAGGKPISAFGVDVGARVLASFINSLPASMSDWYQQPSGVVTGSGCPGSGSSTTLYLAGTQGGVNCPTPAPVPTANPTPIATASPTPTGPTPTGPIAVPTPTPTLTPKPNPSPRP